VFSATTAVPVHEPQVAIASKSRESSPHTGLARNLLITRNMIVVLDSGSYRKLL